VKRNPKTKTPSAAKEQDAALACTSHKDSRKNALTALRLALKPGQAYIGSAAVKCMIAVVHDLYYDRFIDDHEARPESAEFFVGGLMIDIAGEASVKIDLILDDGSDAPSIFTIPMSHESVHGSEGKPGFFNMEATVESYLRQGASVLITTAASNGK